MQVMKIQSLEKFESILYCKECGTKLRSVEAIDKFDMYTGKPLPHTKLEKACPAGTVRAGHTKVRHYLKKGDTK